MLPELPDVKFRVWVRGYGLVDSNPVDAIRGANLTLNVEIAADPADGFALQRMKVKAGNIEIFRSGRCV